MAKTATSFVCRECGYNSPKYLGKCPNCGNWSTMEEFKETTSNTKRPSLVQHSEEAHKTKPMRLDQVSYERVNRVQTSISDCTSFHMNASIVFIHRLAFRTECSEVAWFPVL